MNKPMPFGSWLCEDRVRARATDLHKAHVQAAASNIDTKSPVYYEHIFVKSNRIFHQQQRAMEIERENQRLLKKMGDIHAIPHGGATHLPPPSRRPPPMDGSLWSDEDGQPLPDSGPHDPQSTTGGSRPTSTRSRSRSPRGSPSGAARPFAPGFSLDRTQTPHLDHYHVHPEAARKHFGSPRSPRTRDTPALPRGAARPLPYGSLHHPRKWATQHRINIENQGIHWRLQRPKTHYSRRRMLEERKATEAILRRIRNVHPPPGVQLKPRRPATAGPSPGHRTRPRSTPSPISPPDGGPDTSNPQQDGWHDLPPDSRPTIPSRPPGRRPGYPQGSLARRHDSQEPSEPADGVVGGDMDEQAVILTDVDRRTADPRRQQVKQDNNAQAKSPSRPVVRRSKSPRSPRRAGTGSTGAAPSPRAIRPVRRPHTGHENKPPRRRRRNKSRKQAADSKPHDEVSAPSPANQQPSSPPVPVSPIRSEPQPADA